MYTATIVVMALSATLAAPAAFPEHEEYVLVNSKSMQDQVIVPQKRAALVLDRLLIALQKALHEGGATRYDMESLEPRTAPLRIAGVDSNDLTGLQRRGQGSTRGRVLRCYFNAITCF